MKYYLVLWLTFFGSGDAIPDGSIASMPMESYSSCQKALDAVKKKAKQINGICILY